MSAEFCWKGESKESTEYLLGELLEEAKAKGDEIRKELLPQLESAQSNLAGASLVIEKCYNRIVH